MSRSLICWMLLLALSAGMKAAELRAELSSDTVQVGHASVLKLTVEGGKAERTPELPDVEGLVLQLRGESQQVRVANGKMTRSTVYSYVVGSTREGEYEVPPIKMRVAGEELMTEAFKITVVAAGGAGAPAGMEEGEAEAPDEDKYGFLKFELVTQNRKHVYPGEIAPVRIRAYFPEGAGVSLNSTPRPDGSAFTLHNLTKEPRQAMEVVDGKRYLTVTWFGGLSATKAGKYPTSFSIEGTVTVRDRSARRRRSPFDDPFFGGAIPDDFFAPMIPKEVTLQTDQVDDLEVKELPTEGRPDDFSGAIGEFEFEAVQMPSELTTGEPVQVTVRIAGKGNFALLKEPLLLPADEWRVYPGRDQFVAGDVASFSGKKTFQYNVVPKVPGNREVTLGFSYFDPEMGKYRSVESDAESVEITGEVVQDVAPVEASPPLPEEVGLAPLRSEAGWLKSYQPLSTEPWFYPLVIGSLVLGVGLRGGDWLRHRRMDPDRAARREREEQLRESLEAAERASKAGDAAGFFTAARESIKRRVGEYRGLKPEAVTLADLGDSDDEVIVELMSEADRLDYAVGQASPRELAAWQEKLNRAMDCLETQGKG